MSVAALARLPRLGWWPEALLVIVCGFWLYLMHAEVGWDVPFYFVYVSVGIAYGLRMWAVGPALIAIALVVVSTGGLTLLAVSQGLESPAELIEVPLFFLFYLTMVLHVSSRRRMVGTVARMVKHDRRLHAYATHELMTPLTVARGEVELLIRNGRPSDADLARAQLVVLDELRRSEQLASDLLLAARVSSGAIDRRRISADDLVLDAAERWESSMSGPLRVEQVVCGSVMGARDDLSRALDNLLRNAARHASHGEMTRIGSYSDGDRLVITVVDQGSGIAAEDLPHVFDCFYRGDADRRAGTPGTGVGLAIVKDVVESHGGTVRIDSDLGRGTRVTVELPDFAPLAAYVAERQK